MMTPQELMDLPGYGKAKEELIADGRWLNTITDEDRIDWLAENVAVMSRRYDEQKWDLHILTGDYDPDMLREDIDTAAAQQYMRD